MQTMKCPTCGSASEVTSVRAAEERYHMEYNRICERGHRFKTVEAPLALLADKRELECAVRNINRRIARFNRDLAIAEDERPARVVAAEYGLTDARVRQIRASLPGRAPDNRFAKIVENLERKL